MTAVIKERDSRRERKKAALRDRIIAEGIRLFSRHGIAGVTVEQVAEAADIGKGTIYNYFQTKEDILVAFMAAQEAKVQKRMTSLLKRDLDAPRLLMLYLREQFRLKRPFHQFTRVFHAQMILRGEALAPQLAAMQPAIDRPLTLLFETLRARGRIRSDVETEVLVRAFKTLHFGLSALWAMFPLAARGAVDQLSEESVRQFCRGMEK